MTEPSTRIDIVGVFRRNPAFTRAYLAQLCSFGGDWFAIVALQGLVLDLTGSEALVGLMFTTFMLPTIAMSLIGGAVVDRLDRRLVMIASDVLRAVLVLGWLFVHTAGSLWILFVIAGLVSAATAFFEPASSAIVPSLVRPEDLASANALGGAAWGMMLAVGAGLGGLVAATLGRDAAIIGDAISFVISALLLLSIKGRFRVDASQRSTGSIMSAIGELIRFARADSRVRSMLLVKTGFGITAGVIAMIGVMAAEVFRSGDAGTGLLFSTRGIGALIGPLLFRRLFGDGDRDLFRGITIAFAVFGVGYMTLGVAPTLWVAAIGTCVAHIGGGAQWMLSTIGLQRFAPDHIRGRVFGADFTLMSAAMGVSFAGAGFAAQAFGPRPVVTTLAAGAVLWSVLWTVATRDTWPPNAGTEGTLA